MNLCFYCQSRSATTGYGDHVIPFKWINTSVNTWRPKVPSCTHCNNDVFNGCEMVINRLLLGADAPIIDRKYHNACYSPAYRFRRNMWILTELVDPSVPIFVTKNLPEMTIQACFDQVFFHKMAKGLYWLEHGVRIPSTASYSVELCTAKRATQVENIIRSLGGGTLGCWLDKDENLLFAYRHFWLEGVESDSNVFHGYYMFRVANSALVVVCFSAMRSLARPPIVPLILSGKKKRLIIP